MTGPEGQRPAARAWPAAERAGLTLRGFWASVAAVGAVFLAAASSYWLLFPDPTPGLPFVLAAGAGVVGVPCVVAGLCGVCADHGHPFRTDQTR